jgi:hypothetical protein
VSDTPHNKKTPKKTMEETQFAGTHNLKDNGYRHMPIGLDGKRFPKEHPGLRNQHIEGEFPGGELPHGGGHATGGVAKSEKRNRKAGDRAKRNKGKY